MRPVLAAALCAAALSATTAQADEVWTSEMGNIVYQDESGGAAILTFTGYDAYPATLVIPGLAGNFNDRGTHEAFWIGEGGGDCDAIMSYGDYASSSSWGRALLIFDGPAFPSDLTLVMGTCFGPLDHSLRGDSTAE